MSVYGIKTIPVLYDNKPLNEELLMPLNRGPLLWLILLSMWNFFKCVALKKCLVNVNKREKPLAKYLSLFHFTGLRSNFEEGGM